MSTLFTGIVAGGLTELRARYGEDVVCTPLIEIAPVPDDSVLRTLASGTESYDYLLFTSRFAVQHARCLLHCAPQVVSIGPTTSAALRAAGVKALSQVERGNSYGVVEWFGSRPRGRVLIPRSDIALPIIPDGLCRLGFEVTTVAAYTNRMPAHVQRVDLSRVDRVVFTSPSTVDNFVRLYGSLPPRKEYIARGPVTGARLEYYLTP